MSEHLRHLSRHARIACPCMPNAGLPMLTADGAHYPLTPDELADAHEQFIARVRARAWSAAAAARRPSTCARSSRRCGGRRQRAAPAPAGAGRRLAVPARAVPAGHVVPLDRRAHQRQRLQGLPRGDARRAAGTTASRSPATRSATARTCSTSASTTSAATASPTCSEVVGRLATASTLPLVLDSTEPPVIEAGLELLGGRCVDQLGQLRGRRRARTRGSPRIMPVVQRARRRRRRADHRRGGPGPHRRAQGRGRLAASSTPSWASGACASRTSSSTR